MFARRWRADRVRVVAETWASRSFHTTIGEMREKCKNKIQCIYGSRFERFWFSWKVAKVSKHRKILGENIRKYRRNLKWSQEKLAEKADLHRNYIGDIERGEENVSVDALMRIATALKVRLGDLVSGI